MVVGRWVEGQDRGLGTLAMSSAEDGTSTDCGTLTLTLRTAWSLMHASWDAQEQMQTQLMVWEATEHGVQ